MSGVHLNRRLVLETPERVADGAGGFAESWVALGELWAEVRARTGREKAGGAVALATVGYRITVRAAPVGHSTRPRPEQRLREGGRIFRILAVTERDAAARYLVCYADEEVAA
ncbi:MAG: phage head-tail adaptor, putative, SPP1 family [Rhodobacteraceae bacterium HLUCCO07]|nr:MAG: phage head-tail adaptor, putative, SPP1 family [Rhodobacteraceae bacterium HLUCCO07]